jgi:hypothetical protein
MAKRQTIATRAGLERLRDGQPWLAVFQKHDWPRHVALLARIYDLLEESGERVPFARAEGVLDAELSGEAAASTSAAVSARKSAFVAMMIEELALLADAHDGAGQRYVEATEGGKALLALLEPLLLQRVHYTGAGAEVLMTALGELADLATPPTTDSVLARLHAERRAIDEDIARVEARGPGASRRLARTSAAERFAQADDAARQILGASEAIKRAVEETRAELARLALDTAAAAGDAIALVSDFHARLRESPVYASYQRARATFFAADETRAAGRDVAGLIETAVAGGTIPVEALRRSALASFAHAFASLGAGVDRAVREEVRLLQLQVHYAVTGESTRVRDDLNALVRTALQDPEAALACFAAAPLVSAGGRIVHGETELASLELPRPAPPALVTGAPLSGTELLGMLESLVAADEASVARVVAKLASTLEAGGGRLRLADYPFDLGLLEPYVLLDAPSYLPGATSRAVGRTDVTLRLAGGDVVLHDLPDLEILAPALAGPRPSAPTTRTPPDRGPPSERPRA